ncbi:hypothetical protein [Catellatospora sichuanensis]|uniref:hypothetical protein n=1 Tax=Catellatospora sichuanensis TaxID=1969805 RepID=UPI0011829D2A|nr:hypothetical protein [Catellatospora sichuanensis]
MNTGNRILWTVIGVLLTALGVAGVLAKLGRLPGTYQDSPLLWPGLVEQWRQWQPWTYLGVLVAGLIVAWLGSRLLRIQLRAHGRRHLPDLVFGRHNPHRLGDADDRSPSDDLYGTTQVRYRAIADCLERDLATTGRLQHADVMISGAADAPDMLLTLDTRPGADLNELRRHVQVALGRFTTTTGLTPAKVEISAGVHAGTPSRTR